MTWARVGDESATNPRMMSVMGLPGTDNRTLNELFGFVMRAATQSAAHWTDYVVDVGTLMMLGNGRHEELISLACQIGVFERLDENGITKYKLIEDTNFIHILSKAGNEWEKQRDRDNRDPGLKGPVIMRDGDNCRYCAKEVYWPGPKGNRKGTLDHRNPGEPGTVATMVVACSSCNSARQDNAEEWDKTHPLLPAPLRPKHGTWSRMYFLEHGIRTDVEIPDVVMEGASAGLPASPAAVEADGPGSECDPGAQTIAEGVSPVDPGEGGGASVEPQAVSCVDPGAASLTSAGQHRLVDPGEGGGASVEPQAVSCVDPGAASLTSAGPRKRNEPARKKKKKKRSPSRVPLESRDQSPTRGIGSRDLPGRDGSGRDSGREGKGRTTGRDSGRSGSRDSSLPSQVRKRKSRRRR